MKRILFVDDDPILLEGLKRMLRSQRREWEMLFAEGGDEALGILEKTAVDVVVTDMRMPGMDGAGLLQHVHDRFPGVMRLVLSGQFDHDAGLRAAAVAHQFLTKPCEPNQLKAAIERSTQAGVESDEATRRIVGAIGSLPSAPRTCTLLMEAIQTPDVSMEAIAQIVEKDVALTAKILQLVNSGFFGLPNQVSNIRTAVNLLGMDVLNQLVLSAALLQTFQPKQQLEGFSFDRFERHSQLTAKIAGVLAPDMKATANGTIAALLHDTGKLVLATYRQKEFHQAIVRAEQESIPLHRCEREIFGTSHAEIGGYLLSLWGLPPSTVDAIVFHHQPSLTEQRVGTPGERALVHLANAFAHEQKLEVANMPPIPAKADAVFLAGLGMTERIPAWRVKIRESLGEGHVH